MLRIRCCKYFDAFKLRSSLDMGLLIEWEPLILQRYRRHRNPSPTVTFFIIHIWYFYPLCHPYQGESYCCYWLSFRVWIFIVVGLGRQILLNWQCSYNMKIRCCSFSFRTCSFDRFRSSINRINFSVSFGVGWWSWNGSLIDAHFLLS